MSEGQETEQLEALVAQLRTENTELTRVSTEKDNQLSDLHSDLQESRASTERLQKQLDDSQLVAELEHLRAVDKLREEHQLALRREQALVDSEKERVKSLISSFAAEKAALEEKVRELTRKVESLTAAASAPTAPESAAVVTGGATGDPPATSESTGESTETTTEPTGTENTTEPTGSTVADPLVATTAELLRAQTEAIAAQTQATAAQHLPPLKTFTGEGKLTDADSFERWLEHFEERAKLAGWNQAQQLHQLKLLLDKTALRTF